jgi:hypothetical protein
VQIDFAFKRQDIWTVLTRHRSGWESAFLHLIPSIVNASPSGRIDYVFHIGKIIRDARQQSKSLAGWNQSPIHSRTLTGFAEIVSDDLPVLHLDFACIVACH